MIIISKDNYVQEKKRKTKIKFWDRNLIETSKKHVLIPSQFPSLCLLCQEGNEGKWRGMKGIWRELKGKWRGNEGNWWELKEKWRELKGNDELMGIEGEMMGIGKEWGGIEGGMLLSLFKGPLC